MMVVVVVVVVVVDGGQGARALTRALMLFLFVVASRRVGCREDRVTALTFLGKVHRDTDHHSGRESDGFGHDPWPA
jgi:hypothetical protein